MRNMDETSILASTKKLASVHEEDNHFDLDIIVAINAALFTLNQLGVGPDEPFVVKDEYDSWEDFIPEGDSLAEIVKQYVAFKVKLAFDPPTNSFLVDNIRKQLDEYEFRMLVEAEKTKLAEPDMSDIYVEES